MSLRTWIVMLTMLVAWGGTLHPAEAEVKPPDIAVLVVSDGTNPKMRDLEAQLTAIVKELRNQQGWTKQLLPILSYHFNVPAERKYCLETLKIKPSDLIFIGVVTQENKVVKKVLKAFPRVQDPKSQAYQLIQRVGFILHRDIPLPNSSPTPTVPVEAGSTVALEKLVVTDTDGTPTNTFNKTDAGVFFNVFVTNLRPDSTTEHTVKVRILREGIVDLSMGGPFTLRAGVPWRGRDVLSVADPAGSGLAIAPDPKDPKALTLGVLAGTYHVSVDLDGKEVGQQDFTIKGDVAANGKLALLEAFVSNEKGKPTTVFDTTATGVFCFVTLQNLDLAEEHHHTLTVVFLDPTGKTFQRPLGGEFDVKKGADMSKMEFPDDIDQANANGFLMKDALDKGPFGDWKIQVNLDGQLVKELSFTLKQP